MESTTEIEVTIEEKLDILADLKLLLLSKQQQFDYENADLIYQIKELENIVKMDIYRKGETVKTDKITVSYSKGRETWDTKKLMGLSKQYSEILGCKKIGEPSVSIRLAKQPDERCE